MTGSSRFIFGKQPCQCMYTEQKKKSQIQEYLAHTYSMLTCIQKVKCILLLLTETATRSAAAAYQQNVTYIQHQCSSHVCQLRQGERGILYLVKHPMIARNIRAKKKVGNIFSFMLFSRCDNFLRVITSFSNGPCDRQYGITNRPLCPLP